MTTNEKEEENKYVDYVKKVHDYNKEFRNEIINKAIWIDNAINKILAYHYCKNEQLQTSFISLVLTDGQITFSRKIIMVKKLFQKHYPDLYQQYNNIFKKELD